MRCSSFARLAALSLLLTTRSVQAAPEQLPQQDHGNDASSRQGPNATPRDWFGFGVTSDWAWVNAGGVCSPREERGMWYCVDESQQPYAGRPQPDHENEVGPGFAAGTGRALVSYERLLSSRLAASLIAGWAFGGGPTPPGGSAFFPWHVEARTSY